MEVAPGDLHQLVLPHEVVEVPVEGVGVGLRPGLLQPGCYHGTGLDVVWTGRVYCGEVIC